MYTVISLVHYAPARQLNITVYPLTYFEEMDNHVYVVNQQIGIELCIGTPQLLKMAKAALSRHNCFLPQLIVANNLKLAVPLYLRNMLDLDANKTRNFIKELEKNLQFDSYDQQHHLQIHFHERKGTSTKFYVPDNETSDV